MRAPSANMMDLEVLRCAASLIKVSFRDASKVDCVRHRTRRTHRLAVCSRSCASVLADARPCDLASKRTIRPEAFGLPKVGRRARRSTAGPSWSFPVLAPIPELVCHRRAASRRSSRVAAAFPPAAQVTRSSVSATRDLCPTQSASVARSSSTPWRSLRHQHVGQQPLSRYPARNRTARHLGLHDLVATARQPLAHVSDNHKARRHVFQHLRNVFAQMPQLAAAIRTRWRALAESSASRAASAPAAAAGPVSAATLRS